MRLAQVTDNIITWIFYADTIPTHLQNVYEVGIEVQLEWILRDGKFVPSRAIRDTKILELNNACAVEIISGVMSDADGQMRKYDSDIVDQLNFLQALKMAEISQQPVPYRTWKPDGGGKEWIYLTYAQFCQVLVDGATIKAALLQKCSILKDRVEAAVTVEEIDAINWNSAV